MALIRFSRYNPPIDDSLDERVDENDYTNPKIHRRFQLAEKDKITPEERTRMKDEYNHEESKKQVCV